MIIYHKFGCHYCDAYQKTESGKWKPIDEHDVYAFLSSAKVKDIEIIVDGYAKFLSATK